MKKNLLLLFPVLSGTVFLLATNNSRLLPAAELQKQGTSIVGCAPLADDDLFPGEDGKYITLLPGRGHHTYTISTQSDSAAMYFNQGLSMYYSYHMREAVASFKEAARFDSSCAMVYWGQSLALGPTYNSGYLYKMDKRVQDAMRLMNHYAAGASTKEKALIAAMNRRYDLTDSADKQRAARNQAYAAAMKPLVGRFSDDVDIKALYVDAVMLVHPWEFWNNDGSPKAWTPELVSYCEEILKVNPHHPAALHYYIHVTEASRTPEKALPGADSLLKLFPGIAHMVHMSSHEYERIGYYVKGVKANETADRSLGDYYSLAGNLSLAQHVTHYFAVDAYCAISGGMYRKGLQKALTTRKYAEPSFERTYQQYLYMFPVFAMIRMGKWQDIIQDHTTIAKDWSYAHLLNDFAKGMAYSKTNRQTEAEDHLQKLRASMQDSILKEKFTPFMSSAYECARVAENILAATILYKKGKVEDALRTIRKAIAAEDELLYTEPKIWMLPARQYLGQFLMQLNRPKESEKVYREDLIWNPGNGWSLIGLHQALKAQGKTGELADLEAKFSYSFSEADVAPPGSVY